MDNAQDQPSNWYYAQRAMPYAIGITMAFAAYAALTHWLFTNLDRWQAQALSIVGVAILAGAASLIVQRTIHTKMMQLWHIRHEQWAEAEAMAAVSAALSGTLDLTVLYQLILDQAATVLPCDYATVLLYVDGWAVVAATRGEPGRPVGTRLLPLEGMDSGWLPRGAGAPSVLADTANEPSWKDVAPRVGDHRIRGVLTAPIVFEGEVLGCFGLNSCQPNTYTDHHARLAALFAGRVTQAVRNARLYTAERERARAAEELARLRDERAKEVQAMAEVATALASTLKPDELYERVLTQVANIIPCDCADILLYEDGWATNAASWGRPTLALHTRLFPVLDADGRWLPVTRDAPVYVPDTDALPAWVDVPPDIGALRLRSLIAVPLMVNGEPLGCLTLCTRTPDFYSEHQIQLATALGERVMQALHNARLYTTEQARARSAEELARIRDDFVAVTSHELRTPLTAILGFAELLEARWMHLDDAQRLKHVRGIVQASNRQLRLVKDLLLLHTIENDKFTATARDCAIAPLAWQAVGELKAGYREQEVTLAGPPNLFVDADPARVLQILANLLDNAAKYSPEGSAIRVTWDIEGDTVALRVNDNGSGIPEEGIQYLFTRFGRVPGSRIREGRVGTGLGLYLARQLARAMGGDIKLETTGPMGSTFKLLLPHSAQLEVQQCQNKVASPVLELV